MIYSVTLENFGPIKTLHWENIGAINLFIGANATGKTFLLKALYTLMRASEEFHRGDDPRAFEEVLADKLYWTFQVDKFSDLIARGVEGRLKLSLQADHGCGEYSIGEEATKTIADCKNGFISRQDNSVFIPAKEVLSLLRIILSSREQLRSFGFDDTYYDLAKALNIPPQKGRNLKNFSEARLDLEEILQGRLDFDAETERWVLHKGKYTYAVTLASEGIKKIAVLDNLLGSSYLTPKSLLFIDEPEAALHPEALNKFLEIIARLARGGIQVFIASHSYFTIKKLLLIAQKEKISLPVLSFAVEGITLMDLQNGMPDNSIIRESVRLYKEEVELSFQ